jgi:hypothetical protein
VKAKTPRESQKFIGFIRKLFVGRNKTDWRSQNHWFYKKKDISIVGG